MQNNKSKGFRSFIKGKGYYIVLLLCAVAVGVSGFFLFKGSEPAENNPASESIQSSVQTTGSTEEKVADVIATQETQQSEAPTVKQAVVLRPVEGEQLYSYAADHLAFNETTRDWRTHEGVDYSAELGTPVVAAMDGTVYAIYEDESFGMTVVVQHSGGYTTHYSNLSEEVPVTVGQTVEAGTVLGTVGQTACVETSTAPHLHFAVYANNVPVDPEDFLP